MKVFLSVLSQQESAHHQLSIWAGFVVHVCLIAPFPNKDEHGIVWISAKKSLIMTCINMISPPSPKKKKNKTKQINLQ